MTLLAEMMDLGVADPSSGLQLVVIPNDALPRCLTAAALNTRNTGGRN
jgi:hypothetical protein